MTPRLFTLVVSILTMVLPATGLSGVEPEARQVLDQMCSHIASLDAFRIEAQTIHEVILRDGQKIAYVNQIEMYVKRPDRLYLHRRGMQRDQEIFYDGEALILYGRNQKAWAKARVPKNLDEMLDYATEVLNLSAPGADLLYSDPCSALSAELSSGIYLGKVEVDGTLAHHLAFRNKEVDWQIWIAAEGTPRPVRYVITSKWLTGAPEYRLLVKRWEAEPGLDDGLFHFVPPEDAKEVLFLTPEQLEEARKALRELRP